MCVYPTHPIFQPPTLTFFIGNYWTLIFASDPINFYTEFGQPFLLFNQEQCFIYSTASFLSKLRAKKIENDIPESGTTISGLPVVKKNKKLIPTDRLQILLTCDSKHTFFLGLVIEFPLLSNLMCMSYCWMLSNTYPNQIILH